MNKKITKIGKAVAGSALLVGATLTGAAGLASAADGSQDLGDYPTPFVDEDGEVASTVVVGESAATIDVVGAVNIAGSLGNAAFGEDEVSVEGSGASWSASNGVTLDTVNQKLFMGDSITNARSTLTSDELSLLESGGDITSDYEYDQYISIESGQNVDYSTPGDLDDPVVNVDTSNPSYVAEVVFNDNLDEDATGESIDLFGQEYTVTSDDGQIGEDELVLYGSSQEVQISSGESSTVSIDGEEHTIEVQAVNEDGVVYSVDGESAEQLDTSDDDPTFEIGDTEVRIDSKINLADDSGSATFAVGSNKLTLEDGQEVQVGSDEDDVDGTTVTLTGDGSSVSSIEIEVGEDDSDERFLEAGDSMEDPVFGTFSLAFEGLSPDAQDDAEEIEVQTDGDNDATVDFTTSGGESATINWAHDDDVTDNNDLPQLADSDGDSYHVMEGADLSVDDRTVIESGDFARMIEVTDIETEIDDSSNPETATVTLEDVVTGTEWEVDLEESSDDTDGEVDPVEDWGSTDKVIDGQTYTVDVNSVSTGAEGSVDSVTITDDDDSTHDVYNGLETDNGAQVVLTSPDVNVTVSNEDSIELPTGSITDGDIDGASFDFSSASTSASTTDTVGGVEYEFEQANDGTQTVEVSLTDQDSSEISDSPAVMVVEEEGDDNSYDAHIVSASSDETDDDRVELGGIGNGDQGTAVFASTEDDVENLESHDDNDMSSDYSAYGTFVEEDSSDAGAYSFSYPASQSTAGVGVLGEDGELSTSGGAGSVATSTPMGWPNAAALDSDSNIDSLKTSDELILVGGPSVNALTQELADDNKSMAASEYEEGSAMVQLVNNAFAEGQDALVVAGYAGEDTREAANYISNYADNADDLAGQTQVELSTQQTQNAE